MFDFSSIKTIKKVYIIIFASLAFWSIYGYITLNELIENQKIYAKLINISGKQRMLSQKTTLFVKRSYETNNQDLFNHLKNLRNLMRSDHEFILKNLTSAQISVIYKTSPIQLDKKVQTYLSMLDKYLETKDGLLISEIENYSFKLLPLLNEAVYAFESEINKKTDDLQKRELYILIGALFTLFLEALFIVIPSIRASESSLKKLEELNKSLDKNVRDKVEEIKKKDEILFHQSKMLTVSKLIDNIAHYWRQPLSVITTSASGIIVKKEYGNIEDEELLENLNQIVDNSIYLSNVIERYRDLFEIKRGETVFKIESIASKAQDIISDKILEHNIKTINDIEDIEFHGHESDLIQVLFYIYDNAKDILVERDVKNKIIYTKAYIDNGKINISITDNAGGVVERNIEKVFDPYFTTKDKRMGTGIDLFVSKQILKESFNADIYLTNSKVNYKDFEIFGAEFKIVIPLS